MDYFLSSSTNKVSFIISKVLTRLKTFKEKKINRKLKTEDFPRGRFLNQTMSQIDLAFKKSQNCQITFILLVSKS